MLSAYLPRGTSLERRVIEEAGPVPESAVWFDLVTPTQAEDKLLERALGIAVPTREEMQEIEVSSRLYVENGARYMTATLMCQSDTATPKTTAVTFILAGHKLVTVRYDEPKPFALITNKLARACAPTVSGESIMMDLLDAVIDWSQAEHMVPFRCQAAQGQAGRYIRGDRRIGCRHDDHDARARRDAIGLKFLLLGNARELARDGHANRGRPDEVEHAETAGGHSGDGARQEPSPSIARRPQTAFQRHGDERR